MPNDSGAKWTEELDPLSDDMFSLYFACLALPLCAVGMAGNAVSAAIFLSKKFRGLSINLLFAALSISDFFLLLKMCLTFWPDFLFPPRLYVIVILYLYPTAMIFRTWSVWILIMVTLERYIAVCKPFLRDVYCTRKRALGAILTMLFLSISLNLVRFWDADVEWQEDDKFHFVLLLQANKYYVFWYKAVGTAVALYIIPLTIICSMNLLVVFEIRKSQRYHRSLSGQEQESFKTAYMALYIILVFLICYSLCLILNVLDVIHPAFLNTKAGAMLIPINNGLVALNAATTFLFYVRFSGRYRITMLKGVGKVLRRKVNRSEVVTDDGTMLKMTDNMNNEVLIKRDRT